MKNEVSICKGNVCINAKGKNAEKIAAAAAFAFICLGLALIAKTVN